MASLDKTKAMVGRVCDVDFLASAVSAKKLDNIKFDAFNLDEEVKEVTAELEDGSEIITPISRKLTFEFEFSEIDDADFATIITADEINIISKAGGANGNGINLSIDSLDSIKSQVSGLKTKVTAIKTTGSVATLPFSTTDVP